MTMRATPEMIEAAAKSLSDGENYDWRKWDATDIAEYTTRAEHILNSALALLPDPAGLGDLDRHWEFVGGKADPPAPDTAIREAAKELLRAAMTISLHPYGSQVTQEEAERCDGAIEALMMKLAAHGDSVYDERSVAAQEGHGDE